MSWSVLDVLKRERQGHSASSHALSKFSLPSLLLGKSSCPIWLYQASGPTGIISIISVAYHSENLKLYWHTNRFFLTLLFLWSDTILWLCLRSVKLIHFLSHKISHYCISSITALSLYPQLLSVVVMHSFLRSSWDVSPCENKVITVKACMWRPDRDAFGPDATLGPCYDSYFDNVI